MSASRALRSDDSPVGRSFTRLVLSRKSFVSMATAASYRDDANLGDPVSQHLLGECYEFGRGVVEHHGEAVRWYCRAADQGHELAKHCLGMLHEMSVLLEMGKAFSLYRRAAEQGYVPAQFTLGHCYEFGWGITVDHVAAVRWYREVAEQGDASAQCSLGDCYESGRGVEDVDLEQARLWYQKAAHQGNAYAQFCLGSDVRCGADQQVDDQKDLAEGQSESGTDASARAGDRDHAQAGQSEPAVTPVLVDGTEDFAVEEVEVLSRTVSLRSVLSRAKLRTPARGSNCTHRECIELNVLLSKVDLTKPKNEWNCPHCKQLLGQIILDHDMMVWLAKFPHADEVEVDAAGEARAKVAPQVPTYDCEDPDLENIMTREREAVEASNQVEEERNRNLKRKLNDGQAPRVTAVEPKFEPRGRPRLVYNPRFCDSLLPTGRQCPKPWNSLFVDGRCGDHPKPKDRTRSTTASTMLPTLSDRGAEVVISSEPGVSFIERLPGDVEGDMKRGHRVDESLGRVLRGDSILSIAFCI